MFNQTSETYRRLAHLAPQTREEIKKMACCMNEITAQNGGCSIDDLLQKGFSRDFIHTWVEKAIQIAHELTKITGDNDAAH